MRSRVWFSDDVEFRSAPLADAELVLGDHPRMKLLHDLDIAPRPLFVAAMPHSRGVLDDHVESWFLTGADAPPDAAEGLESVVGLGLGREWLP